MTQPQRNGPAGGRVRGISQNAREVPAHDTATAEAARGLAAAGWRVFPLVPGTKRPQIPGWQNAATSDADTVAGWWGMWPAAGIGIATGGSVFVLDVDTAKGKPGAKCLAALEAAHDPLPATLEVATATGGRHLYFSAADAIRNSAGKIGAGLDIRGAGGYVVAPPTAIGGRAYAWANGAPIVPAPAWLVEAARGAAPVADTPAVEAPSVEATPELLADLREALTHVDPDPRDTWVAVGAALRPLGDAGLDLWIDWSAQSPKHRPEHDPEAWDTIGSDSTGPAAIFAKAQRGGWQNPAALRRAAAVFGGTGVSGGLQLVDVSNIEAASIRPPRFVVHPLIPREHVTLLGGHGGAGKSILALSIAAHVAAGEPWAEMKVERGVALFVSFEDPGELLRYRLRKVIAAGHLDATAVTEGLRIVDATSAGPLMSEQVAYGVHSLMEAPALAELRGLVANAALIVVDNASDAFDGNENARRHVRAFVRALAELGRPNGAAVLLLAHIDKAAARFGSSGNSYSGSSAWHNSARSRLALIHHRGTIELRHEKSNLSLPVQPLRMTWTDAGVLVPMARSADDAGGDTAALLKAITAAIKDGVTVPTARVGAKTTHSVLATLPDLPAHLRQKADKERFWDALAELQRTGKIAVDNYEAPGRHERKKYIIP